MTLTKEEAESLVLLLSDMTQYEYGAHGLGYKERVVIQLMYGKLVNELEKKDE